MIRFPPCWVAIPEKVAEQNKEELGLNKPLIVQYGSYLWQICRLDLGNSMIFKQRVTDAIKDKLPATIELTFFGILITLMEEVALGAYAADKRRSARDDTIRLYGIAIYCIPVYWVGYILQIIHGIWLDIIPVAGRTGASDNLFDTTGNLLYCIGESYANTNPFHYRGV